MTTKRDQFFRDVIDAAERHGIGGFALINTSPHHPPGALARDRGEAMITELNRHLAPRYRVVPAEPQFVPCYGCGAQPVVLEGGVINHVCEASTFRSDATRWDDFQEECKAADERPNPGISGPGGHLLAEIPCSNCASVIRVPIHPEPGDRCYCRGCSTEVKFSGGRLWIAQPFADSE